MPKSPRKESYRVTFIRPADLSVTQIKNELLEPFVRRSISAKVELIRASVEEAKPSFFQRIFG